MMREAVAEAASALDAATDVEVEISIPGGEAVARKTLNPRLGIVGGLSILGTTGIVVPYSCSAWIHSIYRGIDVARAADLAHVAGSTGATSEAAVKALHQLPDHALIDMGDFAGGMLKYLRRHPLPRITVAGGIAKIAKLGQGLLDLHSRAGAVDFDWLAQRLAEAGGESEAVAAARAANTALETCEIAEFDSVCPWPRSLPSMPGAPPPRCWPAPLPNWKSRSSTVRAASSDEPLSAR